MFKFVFFEKVGFLYVDCNSSIYQMAKKRKKHRGRIQAQGGENDLESSQSWSQEKPLSQKDGLRLLENLKNQIPEEEVKKREYAFKKAQEFIEEAAENGGVDSSIRNISFLEPGTKDTRVDIEVKSGIAFIIVVSLLLIIFIVWMI